MSRRWSLEILALAPKSVVASEVVDKAKNYTSGGLTLPFYFRLSATSSSHMLCRATGLSCCQLVIEENHNVSLTEVT